MKILKRENIVVHTSELVGNKVLTDMLVSKLYEIFSGNTPKPERSVLKHCSKGDEGIWDILGYYDPKLYAITICESEVENYSQEIARSLGLTVFYAKLALRELVRLHEHAHSLTHTGKFDEFRGTKLYDIIKYRPYSETSYKCCFARK